MARRITTRTPSVAAPVRGLRRTPDTGHAAATSTEHTPAPGALQGIDFASDEAAEMAATAGLTADAFDDVEPSGQGGYTVADVRSLAGE